MSLLPQINSLSKVIDLWTPRYDPDLFLTINEFFKPYNYLDNYSLKTNHASSKTQVSCDYDASYFLIFNQDNDEFFRKLNLSNFFFKLEKYIYSKLGKNFTKKPSSFIIYLPNDKSNLPTRVSITPIINYQFETYIYDKEYSWLQIDLFKQMDYFARSGRTNEIKLLKIWLFINNLICPNIYAEHLVIKALKNRPKFYEDENILIDNIKTLFLILSNKKPDNILLSLFIDPFVQNNVISDLVSYMDKKLIIEKAITFVKNFKKGNLLENFYY